MSDSPLQLPISDSLPALAEHGTPDPGKDISRDAFPAEPLADYRRLADLVRRHGYELGRRLSAGRQGDVFAATECATGTMVALKSLKNYTPESILRFRREFRSLAN